MISAFVRRFSLLVAAAFHLALVGGAYASGSGLNTFVVVNQSSSASVELGNYFCNQRQVPPNNVIRISWSGGNTIWDVAQFQTNLLNPILGFLASRGLSNQIDYLVLSMDIPFQTVNGSTMNSTTSALFYGLKRDYGPDYTSVINNYWLSEAAFQLARPAIPSGQSFLTCMLTAPTLAQAKRIVDQGVASDGTFPPQIVCLEKTSDPLRNQRYHLFDNSLFNLKAGGYRPGLTTNCDWVWAVTNMAGFQTGLAYFTMPPNSFVPGAMADSMTSYGGIIFGGNDQTTIFAFTGAGAAGSYGTVTEPGPAPDKFPDPNNYFFQSRGFTIAECYYQSLRIPYQGLVVAEPLAAPFRHLASARWLGNTASNVFSGAFFLPAAFASDSTMRPVQQVDWFVDGKLFATATNIPPRSGNILKIDLNGYPVSCVVPTNATINSTANALASAINAPAVTNSTGIIALTHGDRLELRSAMGKNVPFRFLDRGGTNNFPLFYRVASLPGPLTHQLSLPRRNAGGQFSMHVESFNTSSFLVEASSDLISWTAIATNQTGESFDFQDPAAANYPQRFYRTTIAAPDLRPRLSNFSRTLNSSFMRIEGPASIPYIVQGSDDQFHWRNLATNQFGGAMDYRDDSFSTSISGFYRAVVTAVPPAMPGLALLNRSSTDGSLLQVGNSQTPYVLQVSTDLSHWNSIYTNVSPANAQITVTSEVGAASNLTTFVTTPRPSFAASDAFGIRQFSINGTLQVGSWLGVSVTKIDGQTVTIFATNQVITGTPFQLVQQLINSINSAPDLQVADGLVAEDFQAGWFGSGVFNLRARAPGLEASQIKVRFFNSGSLVQNPDGAYSLDSNLSDLQPRAHLYISAGLTNLSIVGSLDSLALVDGFHDVSLVAYEGTSVRTQTRLEIPVHIQNSSLLATLSSPDVNSAVSSHAIFHLQVDVPSASNVTAIHLLSTGGEYLASLKQSTALFSIDASYFGVGRHPFYSIVETMDGRQFRTATKWITVTH